MIYFDTTKAARSGHHSGLMRVSAHLRAELGALNGAPLPAVRWDGVARRWAWMDGSPVVFAQSDWLLTPELFSEAERPGFGAWLAAPGCRTAGIYYDAIPLKFPQTTWPKSVARHPSYMKLLAGFDQVLAISESSRVELVDYWQWGRIPAKARVTAFPLGADGSGRPRACHRERPAGPTALLMVGILEPRKNQLLLLDAAARLWAEGIEFTVHLVGRVNPHFGKPIEKRVRALALRQPRLCFHGALSDAELGQLAGQCLAGVFPSRAEGNGLPVIEALWRGLPCVCSDIPALREHAGAGGCLVLPDGDAAAWTECLRRVVTDVRFAEELARGALNRPLPTWRESAEAVLAALR